MYSYARIWYMFILHAALGFFLFACLTNPHVDTPSFKTPLAELMTLSLTVPKFSAHISETVFIPSCVSILLAVYGTKFLEGRMSRT